MDWVSIITLLISFFTLVTVIWQAISNNRNRKIDRQVTVIVTERRRMQKELFKHIMAILDIDRKVNYSTSIDSMGNFMHDILNHKINVWINLNRENQYSKDLRSNCNLLATWIASIVENPKSEYKDSFLEAADANRKEIWLLIDKYIEEEEKLTKEIMEG